MKGLLFAYVIFNIILGAGVFLLRSNGAAVAVMIVIMVFSGLAFIVWMEGIAAKLSKSIESINKGQLNRNVGKTGIRMFDVISARTNEFLFKVRGLMARFGDVSKKIMKDAHEVEKQAETIKYAAGEIASTVQSIAESVSNQALYTENIMNMIRSFSKEAEDISTNAETSLVVARETKGTIQESFGGFSEIKIKIQESKEYNKKVLDALDSLDNKIRAINTITETVEGISAQTQLLALNAAIEAARAGEAGKGFAVVAGEVGKLADDSSQSAKEIKQLVDGIKGQIRELSVHIQKEADAIDKNLAYATEVLKKSDVINATLQGNMHAAEKITVLTREQIESIGSIEREIEKINDITQQNAAVSEEIGATTEEQLATIEAVHGHMVKLLQRLDESDAIVGDFMQGFVMTDAIKDKVEKTQRLVNELVRNESLLRMNSKAAADYLKSHQSKFPFVEFMAIINNEGYLTASTIEIPEEFKDSSAKPYFQKASLGESMVSEEYISIASNNYNISVTVPFELEGRFGGLIIADININE